MALAQQSEGLKAGVAEPFPLSLERELGAVVHDHGTQFAIWAPSAKSVTLRFFTKGSSMEDGDVMVGTHQPELQSDGAWTIHFDENLHGTYYDYLVEQQDGNLARTADPWAKGAGVNGRRSMVVDLARTDPAGWEHDEHLTTPLGETMVAEMHVASFSANPHGGFPLEHCGKYLAFTDLGTTVDGKGKFPTGIDYFKQLGVTAIQLLPFYDYGSVDENDPRQYNWGYDPLNYNVPEGSYSTDPFDGTVRITECKQMIQSLHAQGFKVIMDVVYNHMYTADNWFERVVPGYFVRRNADGTLSNGSGCGDDMASERAMMRRYIVDSVTYWAREYHIDGFRFDLMGLIDTDTMNAVRRSLDALPGGKDLIMYGEPWAAGLSSTLPGTELANKEGLHLLDPRIGHFCDRTRDAIKGHVFERQIKGYVNGNAHDTKPQIELAVDAWRTPETNEGNAGQIIQYVSAHDDWTLWDKLCLSMIGDGSPESANKAESEYADDSHRTLESRDDALERAYRAEPGPQTHKVLEANTLAVGLIYTAAGIPFMLAGEEFGKTKFGNDNSFNSGVKVNELDWARAERMQGLVDYYRRLIAVRRANPSLFDAEHIAVEAPGNAVAYRSDDVAVLVNPDDEEYSLPVERIDSAFADSLHDDLPEAPEFASHAEERWVCVLDSSGTSTGEFRQTGMRIAGGRFPMPARTLSIWKCER
ncbi:pullulanase [Bifidobacterium animalis subsp. animalis MCC 1489]|uniref:Pullulanase n=1 Tax=Bifidobacterium animalis subsp. animalis IM386 TaxID=1402194 RepID=A0AAV2W2G8_9BIFI|nr:alpha-amylase family glycosyl hydrolase [Bifidobacterium animalis]AFI63704.1 pullulanase precursor [Bifidobacterium animalis subsp. animalis ATCC 25527]AYN24323.1 pullulanase [Bifidobacterium animalis subsp. animalis]KFI41864.1 pullulanase [Bifidobacterium animalis subsp. animalis]KOA64580.1 pullulanase [Bifidobacterium animalis subsp. animalis MCC 1489]CDI66919.1 Pullulanase [Bifidobacterium animalis subsp. animalis IM386]